MIIVNLKWTLFDRTSFDVGSLASPLSEGVGSGSRPHTVGGDAQC